MTACACCANAVTLMVDSAQAAKKIDTNFFIEDCLLIF